MRLQDLLERIDREFEEIKQMIGVKKIPLHDIVERENELHVLIDLPGFSKKDVDVEVGDDYIKIKANKKRMEGKYIVNERSYSFYRHISLPYEIDANNAKAKMKNGVLEIILPIKRKHGKKIKVE